MACERWTFINPDLADECMPLLENGSLLLSCVRHTPEERVVRVPVLVPDLARRIELRRRWRLVWQEIPMVWRILEVHHASAFSVHDQHSIDSHELELVLFNAPDSQVIMVCEPDSWVRVRVKRFEIVVVEPGLDPISRTSWAWLSRAGEPVMAQYAASGQETWKAMEQLDARMPGWQEGDYVLVP